MLWPVDGSIGDTFLFTLQHTTTYNILLKELYDCKNVFNLFVCMSQGFPEAVCPHGGDPGEGKGAVTFFKALF